MNGPEHYREAERILRAAGIADLDSALVMAQRAAAHATLALVAAQTAPQLETAPAVAYVYRAAWGTTPLGTYTNHAAARTHCEADATNNADDPTELRFDWDVDESEPDSPYELLIVKNGIESTTDYTVTRIEVATEYDPEADA